MKITEEENSKLKIVPPKLRCDLPLGNVTKPLPNTCAAIGIIGSAGSGKTSWALSLLTNKLAYKKVFHDIYVVMPPQSRDSIASNIFDKHDPEKLYDELTPQILADIRSKVEHGKEEGYNSLLIIDDCTVYLKNKTNEMMLKDLIYNRRHLNLSIWLLSQSFTQIGLPIRKTLSHLVLFKCRNKKEYESVFEELIFLPKEVAEKVVRFVYQKPHDFMFSSTATGEIYRNFNLLKISDE